MGGICLLSGVLGDLLGFGLLLLYVCSVLPIGGCCFRSGGGGCVFFHGFFVVNYPSFQRLVAYEGLLLFMPLT